MSPDRNPGLEQRPIAFTDVVAFLKANYMALAVGAAVIVLAAVGLTMFLTQQRRNEERASQMLLVVQTPKQWEELLSQYPDAKVAPVAVLALASGHYNAGDYDRAAGAYGDFLKKYPRHMMAPAAELGRIQCQEGRGEIEPALSAYALFAGKHPDHFLEPQALFGQARCLQRMRRYSEARATYEDFIVAHPKSEWAPQAELALRFLDREIRAQRSAAEVAAPSARP